MVKGPARQKSNTLNSHYKVPERKGRKKHNIYLKKIVAENFPNLRKERFMSRKYKEPQTR